MNTGSRRRTLHTVVGVILSLASTGCGHCDGSNSYNPFSPTPTTITAHAEISPQRQAAKVGESVTFEGRIVGTLPSGATVVQTNWDIQPKGIASFAATNANLQTVTVRCDAVGNATITLTTFLQSVTDASAVINCEAATTTTTVPPTSGPTVESIIGSYTKKGRRRSSNCNPPVFTESWDADLTVEASSDGNLGIRFRQSHSGAVVLQYSQFTAESGPNRELILKSGNPTRTIGGRDYIAHIEMTFHADGTITGTETLVGPDGCVEIYDLSGRRK